MFCLLISYIFHGNFYWRFLGRFREGFSSLGKESMNLQIETDEDEDCWRMVHSVYCVKYEWNCFDSINQASNNSVILYFIIYSFSFTEKGMSSSVI